MLVQNIKLSTLKHAKGELAIRQTDRDEGLKALAANIKQFGLLVPLLVRPDGTVVDGNRRLAALKSLKEPPEEVPCIVDEEAGIGEALSANTMRQAMNPMDAYDAYSQMVADGVHPKDIAKVFGVKLKEVHQILALAALAPEIKAEIRAGSIDMETAEALTMSSDHKQQLAAFGSAERVSAWSVRRFYENASPDMAHALFDPKQYETEGGAYLVDLFADDKGDAKLAANAELFWRLQEPFIAEQVAQLQTEGWSKVERIADRSQLPKGIHAGPFPKNVKKKLRQFHVVYLGVGADGRVEQLPYSMPDPDKKAELRKAEAKETAKPKSSVETGMEEAVERIEEAEDEEEPFARSGFSRALSDDLAYHRRCQLKEAVAQIATEHGARLVLYGLLSHDLGAMSFMTSPVMTEAHAQLRSRWQLLCDFNEAAQVDLDAKMVQSPAKLWERIAAMDPAQVNQGLAAIAMETLHVNAGGEHKPVFEAIMAATPTSARLTFQPNEAFWKRTSRAYMLQALAEVVGPEIAGRFANEKIRKVELAKKMGRWFTEPSACREAELGYASNSPYPATLVAKFESWVPLELRYEALDTAGYGQETAKAA